jgi:hypothetical protein
MPLRLSDYPHYVLGPPYHMDSALHYFTLFLPFCKLSRQSPSRMPLYCSMESLANDQEKVTCEGNGKLFKDLINESDRVKKSAQDLKLRFIEIEPPTSKSKEINSTFIKSLDSLITWSENAGAYLQSDLSHTQESKMLKYLYEQSKSRYVGSYFYDQYEKQVSKVNEAEIKMNSK